MDARLVDSYPGFEVQYFRDGRFVVATAWPSRGAAVSDANARLKELFLAGWATHW